MTVNNIDKDTEDQVEKNKIEEDKQEEHEGNGFITFIALAALFFFPFILLCAWLFPEYLPFFGLNVKMCYMIVLQFLNDITDKFGMIMTPIIGLLIIEPHLSASIVIVGVCMIMMTMAH